MNSKLWLVAAGIALALSLTAVRAAEPADAASAADVSIPFANHGGIRDWQADRDRGLWVQDIHDNWYYAAVMGPCIGLSFAESIGFDTRPQGSFDRFSTIVVPRQGRCTIQTLRPSGAPPSRHKKALKVTEPQTSKPADAAKEVSKPSE